MIRRDFKRFRQYFWEKILPGDAEGGLICIFSNIQVLGHVATC